MPALKSIASLLCYRRRWPFSLTAKPNSKDYGILSVLTQEAADVELAFRVSANCFRPRPTVGSAVVRLTIKSHDGFDPIRHEVFVGWCARRSLIVEKHW